MTGLRQPVITRKEDGQVGTRRLSHSVPETDGSPWSRYLAGGVDVSVCPPRSHSDISAPQPVGGPCDVLGSQIGGKRSRGTDGAGSALASAWTPEDLLDQCRPRSENIVERLLVAQDRFQSVHIQVGYHLVGLAANDRDHLWITEQRPEILR